MLLLPGAPVAGGSGRSGPLPWELAVRVRFEGRSGPESFRTDLERALASDLRSEGCFRSVVLAAEGDDRPAADLLLTVVLEDYEDEQIHDTTIAQEYDRGAMPDVAQSYVARISAGVRLSLDTVPEGGRVRFKKVVRRSEHRPVLYEDARTEARRELLEGIVRTARGLVCRGSAKKWRREIREAREEGGAASR